MLEYWNGCTKSTSSYVFTSARFGLRLALFNLVHNESPVGVDKMLPKTVTALTSTMLVFQLELVLLLRVY